jgi:hypothetical protein
MQDDAKEQTGEMPSATKQTKGPNLLLYMI